MTMYDRFSSKGLETWRHEAGLPGSALARETFLQTFEEFFQNHRKYVLEAQRFSDRRYPYPRRVADKRLWLLGNERGELIISRFRASLLRLPIRS